MDIKQSQVKFYYITYSDLFVTDRIPMIRAFVIYFLDTDHSVTMLDTLRRL